MEEARQAELTHHYVVVADSVLMYVCTRCVSENWPVERDRLIELCAHCSTVAHVMIALP